MKTIQIDEKQHEKLKYLALRYNKNLKEIIKEAFTKYLEEQPKKKTWREAR